MSRQFSLILGRARAHETLRFSGGPQSAPGPHLSGGKGNRRPDRKGGPRQAGAEVAPPTPRSIRCFASPRSSWIRAKSFPNPWRSAAISRRSSPIRRCSGAIRSKRRASKCGSAAPSWIFSFPIALAFRHSHPAMVEMEKPQIPQLVELNRPRALAFARFLDSELATRRFLAGDCLQHRRHHGGGRGGFRGAGAHQIPGRTGPFRALARRGFGPPQRESLTLPGSRDLDALAARIRACRICVEAPEGRPLPHAPRPVLRVSATARLLIAGQAPGVRVHASGLPFDDPSGERLRGWMGVDRAAFYDRSRIAIAAMGFCFPGHDSKGGDLPPRRECRAHWHDELFRLTPQVETILAVGRPRRITISPDRTRLAQRRRA